MEHPTHLSQLILGNLWTDYEASRDHRVSCSLAEDNHPVHHYTI